MALRFTISVKNSSKIFLCNFINTITPLCNNGCLLAFTIDNRCLKLHIEKAQQEVEISSCRNVAKVVTAINYAISVHACINISANGDLLYFDIIDNVKQVQTFSDLTFIKYTLL